MADEADIAMDFQEGFLTDSLVLTKHKTSMAMAIPDPNGKCLNCQNKVEGENQRWCDQFCRDDWQRIESSRRAKLGYPPVYLGKIEL